MSDICIVGSMNMDLVIRASRIPRLGETLVGDSFITVPGGKGANQAVAAAKLGCDTVMIGLVGSDVFGSILCRSLKENNVNTSYISTVEGVSTGIAMITVINGDNFIITDKGANDCLTPQMMTKYEDVIAKSKILLLQLEIPVATIEKAIEIAYANNVKVLLNPAPANNIPEHLYSKISIFTPNEIESEFYTGKRIDSIDDAIESVKILSGKGLKQIAITLGSRGVVYNSGNRIIHKEVPKVKTVDTTAAGDSFSAAVAAALTQGKSIEAAIDLANVVGTMTVMKSGAQSSLPTIAEVQKYIDEMSGNMNKKSDIMTDKELQKPESVENRFSEGLTAKG